MDNQRLSSFIILSALSLAACAAELDTNGESSTDGEPLAQVKRDPPPRPFANQKPFITKGVPTPKPPNAFPIPSDPDLKIFATSGMGSIKFMTCVSKAEGEPDIVSATKLPVGNGRYLECATDYESPLAPATSKMELASSTGAPYCFTGSAKEYRTGGDPRLTIELVRSPATGPWVLKVTSKEAWEVERVRGGWGAAWPVWLEINYTPHDLQPLRRGDTCLLY